MIIAISNYPDPTAKAGLKVFATNKLIDQFLGDLHKHTAQVLLTQKFDTLENAIESAIKYITKFQYHYERFNRSNIILLTLPRISCNFCKKLGHTEDECRKKSDGTQNRDTTFSRSSNSQRNGQNFNRYEFNSTRTYNNSNTNRFNNTERNQFDRYERNFPNSTNQYNRNNNNQFNG